MEVAYNCIELPVLQAAALILYVIDMCIVSKEVFSRPNLKSQGHFSTKALYGSGLSNQPVIPSFNTATFKFSEFWSLI